MFDVTIIEDKRLSFFGYERIFNLNPLFWLVFPYFIVNDYKYISHFVQNRKRVKNRILNRLFALSVFFYH